MTRKMGSAEQVASTAIHSNTYRKDGRAMELMVFLAVIFMWLAFGSAILFSQTSISSTWRWFVEQSLLVQIPLGVLFLPWTIGAWIWESSWPMAARGIAVTGVAWANIYLFSPWRVSG